MIGNVTKRHWMFVYCMACMFFVNQRLTWFRFAVGKAMFWFSWATIFSGFTKICSNRSASNFQIHPLIWHKAHTFYTMLFQCTALFISSLSAEIQCLYKMLIRRNKMLNVTQQKTIISHYKNMNQKTVLNETVFLCRLLL